MPSSCHSVWLNNSISCPLFDTKKLKDLGFVMWDPMCSSPFMNSLNFGPLHCIVVGFFDVDRPIWCMRGRRDSRAPRGLRSAGVTSILMSMPYRPSRSTRRILSLSYTHNIDIIMVWCGGKIMRFVRQNWPLCSLFPTPRAYEKCCMVSAFLSN